MFTTIGIVTKPNNPESQKVAQDLVAFLAKLGVKTVFYQQEIKEQAQMIIVLGGDGTFVGAARNYVDANIPLLGVNLGNLGFLTDIDADQMFQSIEEVLEGKYQIEEKFMLECTSPDGVFVALNDVVVHRGNSPRMINTDVYINEVFANNGSADGLIISTPTGSTAYALSSGGPIINVGVEAISLVYISPHAMTYRPFIFDASSNVRIKLHQPTYGAVLTIDGQITIPLDAPEEIFIKKYHIPIKLIHPHNYHFFSILRDKLNWNK